jgi:hypothetical protein
MNNEIHMNGLRKVLEKQFDGDMVYPYFSAFYDVVVLGHSSHPDDNPHERDEQPCYDLYRMGAVAAEKLLARMRRADVAEARDADRYIRDCLGSDSGPVCLADLIECANRYEA